MASILAAKRDSETLIRVALGREKADLVVTDARLVNVYSGEVIDGISIAARDGWIAYVGPDPGAAVGSGTEIIDAGGCPVIPGLVDGHTHLAWLFTISEFLTHAMAGGTTTVITETMEPFPVAGYDGVVDFLDSFRDQPIKLFGTAPAMVSTSPAANGVPVDVLKRLLARDEILGLGESYWQALLQQPETLLPSYRETLQRGKTLEGHSAGASEKKLNAYVAAGISSCHEPITVEEVLDRIRLGLHVMIREGSIRRDLETISKIKDRGIDTRRLILSTDGVSPKDLIEKGNMDYVLQKAIDCGFDPVTAVQMATLNVAEHFGIDDAIGGIAPGRCADLVVLPDLETIAPSLVISQGRVIAREGKCSVRARVHAYSQKSRETIRIESDLAASDIAIRFDPERDSVHVRVIDMVTDLVTREVRMDMPVIRGELRSDPDRDIIKVAAIDRTHRPGHLFAGMIRGFGLKDGAIASSAAWDTTDIIVVGADDRDMALAVNRIVGMQGGAAVCAGGRVLDEIPMPVFGIISELSMAELARRIDLITRHITGLGCRFPDPLLSLNTLTGAAIPFFRICEEGLVDFKTGRTFGLFTD